MTHPTDQHAAISCAVRQALHKMGLRRLKSGEFFGTNQQVKAGDEIRHAA